MNGLTITPEQLTEILQTCNVDMSEWGKKGRRNVADILATIQKREGSLLIDADGIAFVLKTARALIRDGKGNCLIVGWKNLRGEDHGNLKVAGLPGGKLAENEDPRVALERELFEELDLQTGDYSVVTCETKKGSPVIRALPNLRAVRTDYIFTVMLRPDHPYLALESFEREEHGHAALFKWIPETEWSARQQRNQKTTN